MKNGTRETPVTNSLAGNAARDRRYW